MAGDDQERRAILKLKKMSKLTVKVAANIEVPSLRRYMHAGLCANQARKYRGRVL